MTKVKIGNVYPSDEYLLARCAPAGYGLGNKAPLLTSANDLNEICQSGWYRWGDSAPNNAPVIKRSNKYGYMRVDGSDEGTFTQTVYSVFGDARGLSVTRCITEGVVSEWEWVNPPMEIGVEYRTTERWQDKPVYTKLLNFGASADGSSVAHELNPNTIIRYSAVAGSIPLPHFNTVEPAYQITVSVGATDITMACGASRTGLQTYVQVWYIKV